MKRYILYVRFVVSNYFRNQTWLAVKLAILLVLSVDIQATAGNVVPTLIPHVAESIGNDNVVLQPSLTIVGRVVNGENEPLAGVSISVKYGKANAVSEANGMYK